MKTTFIKTLFIILLITSFSAGGFVVFTPRAFAEESGEFQIDSAVSQDQISPLTAPEELSDDLITTNIQLLTESQSVENTEKGGESALENTGAEILELDIYPEGAIETADEFSSQFDGPIFDTIIDSSITSAELTATSSVSDVVSSEASEEQPTLGEIASSSGENPIWKINDDGSATSAQDVNVGLIYYYPKNEDVSVEFISLPEILGTITIREIKLSREEQEMLGALSDTAYDITSTIENGTFTYDLTLPLPESAKDKEVVIKSAETTGELNNAKIENQPKEKTPDNITIKGLDHFTIFMVASPNPIFDPSAKVYYPSIFYDANGFVGHGNTAYYKMWFGSESGVGYAYSNDGKNWVEGTNPVSNLTNANHPLVEYYNDGFSCNAETCYYRMWYWDTAQLYSMNSIRYAESSNGISWINDQPITGNIIAGTGWHRGSYGPIDVLFNPGASNSGTNLFDYSFVMYFDATDGGFEEIGLGYSSDGIAWNLYGSDPVLAAGNRAGGWGNTTVWDSSYTTIGSVIKEADGKWHMWYSGGQKSSNEGIGYATSTDGLSWIRYENNPIFHKSDNVDWRNNRTYTPQVIYDPDEFSGHGDSLTYKMWFSGRDASNYAIGYAYTQPTTVFVYTDTAACTAAGHTDVDCFDKIQDAINAVVSGGTVNVAAGTYNENPIINKQLALLGPNAGVNPNIQIRAPEAIISMETVPGGDNLGIVNITAGADNTIFDGFEVRTETLTGTVRGIEINGADYVTIRNIKVHHTTDVLVYPNKADYLLIENCEIYDSTDEAVKPSSSIPSGNYDCDDVTIRNCVIHDARGIWVYHGTRWTIENNMIHDVEFGIALDSNGNHVVGNNLIYAFKTAGIKAEKTSTIVNNTITQSTAVDTSSYYGSGIAVKNAFTGGIIKNNIISSCKKGIYNRETLPSITIDYNDVWDNPLGNYVNGFTAGAHDISVNPQFVGGLDYHLQSLAGSYHDGVWTVDADYSLCIDKGDSSYDFSNEPSPNGDHINMGAYGHTVQASKTYIPTEVWVDDNYVAGDCGGHIWGVNAFDKIQDGIGAVAIGGTVNVAAGTYVQIEDLVINKWITLIGDSSDPKPTIQFDGMCDSLIIQADGAVVNNLRIYKSTTSVDYSQCSDNNVIEMPSHWQPTPPSTVDSGDFTLKNCIVDFGRRGIRVSSNGDVVIKDSEFLNQYRDSIFVANLRGGTITIKGNTFTNGGKKAIVFESGPDTDRFYGTVDIKNNTVNGGNSRGNFIVYNHWADPSLKVDMTIRTNIINQITSNAIAIYYPVDYDKFSNILVEDNDIYDAGRGIVLDYADGGPDINPNNGQIIVENNVFCRFTSSDLTPAIPIYDSGIDSDNKAIGVKGSGPTDTNGFGTISGKYGTAAVAAVNYGCDTILPIVDAGPNIASSSDIIIDGSSAIDASGIKSYLWEKVSGTGDVTFSDNTILNPLVSATVDGAYILKLTVTDNFDNFASDEMCYTKLSDNQIIASSDTNVTAEQNEIVINCSNNSTAANISIPSSVNDARINVNSLINDDGFFATVILPQILISAVTSISSNPVIVSMPVVTTITVLTGWNGTINALTVKENSSVSVPVDSNQTADVSSVIEIGYGDVKLVFDKAVRVLLPEQAGKYVGYLRNETFISIDSVCLEDNQSAGDALLPEGDCKIDSGSDLVIWTKHFTQFITYAVSQNPPSSGGGGGGGGGLPPEAYLPPTSPATGFYILVNSDATETSSRLVSLFLGGSYDTTYVMISESPEFPDGWQASYLASRVENHASFTLSEDEGTKTVYVRFCTKWSRCSEIVSDSIVYKIKIEPKEPERPLATEEPIRPIGEEPIKPTGEEVTDTAKSTIKEITGTEKPGISHKFFLALIDNLDFVMRKLWKYGASKIKSDREIVLQQAMVAVPIVRQNLLVNSKMVKFILKPMWEIKSFF